MSKFASPDVGFFLADGFDLLGVSTEINEGIETVTEDVNPLGQRWMGKLPPGTLEHMAEQTAQIIAEL